MKRLCFLTLILSFLLIPPTLAQDGPDPNAQISWPPPVYAVQGQVTVRGSANLPDMVGYFLEYRPLPDDICAAPADAAWFPATLPAPAAVQDDVLGVWDTSMVPDGLYELRLTINLASGDPAHDVVSPLRVMNNPPGFAEAPLPVMEAGPPAEAPTEPLSAGTPNATWTPVEREANGVPVVLVPAGCFMMGSDEGYSDEVPVHEVCLDSYWIGKTEVTNAQYAGCVKAGFCTPPENLYSDERDEYYNNPDFANYPVIYISWRQARAYAEWLGGSLPTEAQWEYAARGPEGWTYPWGEAEPTSAIANYDYNVGDTSLVGLYPKNASWVGAVDMAGNVAEWTNSLYRDYPYDATDGREMVDPSIDAERVTRGGHYQSGSESQLVSIRRDSGEPDDNSIIWGFRVVVVDLDNLPPPEYQEEASEN